MFIVRLPFAVLRPAAESLVRPARPPPLVTLHPRRPTGYRDAHVCPTSTSRSPYSMQRPAARPRPSATVVARSPLLALQRSQGLSCVLVRRSRSNAHEDRRPKPAARAPTLTGAVVRSESTARAPTLAETVVRRSGPVARAPTLARPSSVAHFSPSGQVAN